MLEIVVILNIVISLTILLGGYFLKFHTKFNVDSYVGFRTKRAMSSNEAWRFANQNCGKLWLLAGTIGFVLTIIVIMLFVQSKLNENTEMCVQSLLLILQIIAIIFSVSYIEKQLKNKYDDNNAPL